jgi:hypothetical protein
LKRKLERIESGERRAEAVRLMRKVLDDYASHKDRKQQPS